MFLSYAKVLGGTSPEKKKMMHTTADVYNTGLVKSYTGLATSSDGIHYNWRGGVFFPQEQGWDSYGSRICCLIYTPPVFVAFYDGLRSVSENYEERTGLAQSFDLSHYERVTTRGPVLVSPHSSGCLRYIDAVQLEKEIYFYYEYAKPDGSHELRMSKVRLQ